MNTAAGNAPAVIPVIDGGGNIALCTLVEISVKRKSVLLVKAFYQLFKGFWVFVNRVAEFLHCSCGGAPHSHSVRPAHAGQLKIIRRQYPPVIPLFLKCEPVVVAVRIRMRKARVLCNAAYAAYHVYPRFLAECWKNLVGKLFHGFSEVFFVFVLVFAEPIFSVIQADIPEKIHRFLCKSLKHSISFSLIPTLYNICDVFSTGNYI